MVLRVEQIEALTRLVGELSARLDDHPPIGTRKSSQWQRAEDEKINELKYSRPALNCVECCDTATIDFRENKLPAFVVEIMGFSSLESFGRWTDSDIARIVFSHPLPIAFSIEITMMTLGPNVNQPGLVVAGGDAKILLPTNPKLHCYQLELCCKCPGKMVEFLIPHALSPQHLSHGTLDDTRRIGFGIQSITIRKQAKSFAPNVLRLPALGKAREKLRALVR
jgi:hypothetical protein